MKNGEIINIVNNLELMEKRESKAIEINPTHNRMNIVIAYKVFANKKLLTEKLKPYYESLQELMKRYDVKFITNEENGEIIMNTDILEKEKKEEYARDLNNLLNIDVEIDSDIQKVSIEQFGDYRISYEDLAALSFMINN